MIAVLLEAGYSGVPRQSHRRGRSARAVSGEDEAAASSGLLIGKWQKQRGPQDQLPLTRQLEAVVVQEHGGQLLHAAP